MPHVSAKRLKEEEETALRSSLVEIFKIIGRDRSVSNSLGELLTHTEMIMLAKRLSIIYLVSQGVPTLDIADILKTSTSTIQIVEKKFDRGGYQNLRRVFGKLESSLKKILKRVSEGEYFND